MNLLITTQYGGIAGSTYSILYLARGLIGRGHQVHLCAPRGSLLQQLAGHHDVPFEEVSFRSKFHLRSIFKLKRLVSKYNVQLINAQESKDRYNVIFLRILFKPLFRIILTRRQRVADNNFLKRWLHLTYSDKIVVVSKGLQQLIVRKGFPLDHTLVIHNGLPLKDYVLDKSILDSLRAKYGLDKNDIVVGCIARLKRQDMLVMAMRYLPENYKLIFVGIDKEKFTGKFPKVDLQGIDHRIKFIGPIRDRAEVIHHYPLMDVSILPSQMDGFGLVLIESMAMGIPVIGSDYGGIPDVIDHGTNGFIFQNDNIEQLKNQLMEITSNDELRSKFICNGYKTVRDKFSMDRMIKRYEEVFENIIDPPPDR